MFYNLAAELGNITVLYIFYFQILMREVEKTKVFGLNNNMDFLL